MAVIETAYLIQAQAADMELSDDVAYVSYYNPYVEDKAEELTLVDYPAGGDPYESLEEAKADLLSLRQDETYHGVYEFKIFKLQVTMDEVVYESKVV